MFQVEWLQVALNELAAIWNDADSAQRHAITTARHDLEQRLQRNAQDEGESRTNGRRIAFVPPLAITYRIEADGRTVTVLHVRLYGKNN